MDVLALWNRQKRLFSGQKSPIYRDLSIQGFAPKRKAVSYNMRIVLTALEQFDETSDFCRRQLVFNTIFNTISFCISI